jgi:hypothetical protein
LVAPTLRARKVTPDEILTEAPIDIVDFDIEQVWLRLRLRRLAEAIAPLERMPSSEESTLVVRSIIVHNLRYKITSTAPWIAQLISSHWRVILRKRQLPASCYFP